jgi:hypothetical protein
MLLLFWQLIWKFPFWPETSSGVIRFTTLEVVSPLGDSGSLPVFKLLGSIELLILLQEIYWFIDLGL